VTPAAPAPARRVGEWHLVRLARDGRLAEPRQLERILALAPAATDGFLFCPGGVEDEEETRRAAARFFALLEVALAPLRERVAPLLIALHWRSRPVALAPASRALLAQLADAEVPAGPEEDAALDALRRRILKPDAGGGRAGSPAQALACWVAKRRAAQVGERLGREHLAALTHATRTHLVGHTLGATLAAAAVLGGARPASLMLLLPALSAFAFAREVPGTTRPGVYHRILAEGRVRGRVTVLHSRQGLATSAFHTSEGGRESTPRLGRAGRAHDVVATTAMNTAGARGVGAPDLALLEAQQVGLPLRPLVNVAGDGVLGARAAPVHGHREVAILVLLAAGLLEPGPEGLRPARASGEGTHA